MRLRIASWNINSVRLRMPIVARFVRDYAPDVLCLQEIKVDDPLFPIEDARATGLPHVYFSGQKSYHGVAIFSRFPLTDVVAQDILGNGERRHIAATLPGGVRVENYYVPAGGDIPDPEANPKFRDKLAFMDALIAQSSAQKKGPPTIMLGDMNIAPHEHDVWSHKQLLDVVSHTPIEVERMSRLQAARDWVDTHRVHVPLSQKLYSWWSYRARDWAAADRGRRLDHIWVTPDIAPRLLHTEIVKDARGWDSPSDHVPILADFEWPEGSDTSTKKDAA